MKKLIFFISLLFIFSISSCDNSLSPTDEKAFIENLERKVKARKPYLKGDEIIEKVILSRTGEGTFEGYIDYNKIIWGYDNQKKSMKISVILSVDGNFRVQKR